jgi:hypothetical protein
MYGFGSILLWQFWYGSKARIMLIKGSGAIDKENGIYGELMRCLPQ